MKVIAISDTHGMHDKLTIPECDLLIHSGDFSRTGSYQDHYAFAKWMKQQKSKYKVVVPGNHDRYSFQQEAITKELFTELDIYLLIDELITLEGLKIYGSPWTPKFRNWYWMKDRGEDIAKVWNNIPLDLDILITHGPAYGILDISIHDKIHVGCEELYQEVQYKKPLNHVFGHIHYYGGLSYKENGITYYNASICNEEYKPVNAITEFDI